MLAEPCYQRQWKTMNLLINDSKNYNTKIQAFDFESIGVNPGTSTPIYTDLRVSNPVLQPEVTFTLELPPYENFVALSTGCGDTKIRFRPENGLYDVFEVQDSPEEHDLLHY
jgi:hypothetical protein